VRALRFKLSKRFWSSFGLFSFFLFFFVYFFLFFFVFLALRFNLCLSSRAGLCLRNHLSWLIHSWFWSNLSLALSCSGAA
jgi:hypothetical protein